MNDTGTPDRPAGGGGSTRAAAVLAGMLVAGVIGGAAALDNSPRLRAWLARLGRRPRPGAPAAIGAAADIDPAVLAASLEILAADEAELLRDEQSKSQFLMTMIGVGLAAEQLRARGPAGVDAERRRLLDSAIAALSTERAIGIANRILVDDDAPVDRASRALIVRIYDGGDRVDRRYRPIEPERVAALLRLPGDPVGHPEPRLGAAIDDRRFRRPRLSRMNDTVRHELAPTGALRAVINLGNPVLAQGTPQAPSGITVDLARALAGELGVPLELHCVDAARKSVDAIATGRVDVGFVAIDPGRAEQLAFTEPYVVIEGLYAVPADSSIAGVDDVDRAGVRIGAKLGSAYDLHLSRQLRHAEVVRGEEGTEAFEQHGLEVAAGIRQPLAEYVAAHPGMRLLEPAFMQIRQAMAVSTGRPAAVQEYVRGFVEARKADGAVAAALARAGQDPSLAAPAA